MFPADSSEAKSAELVVSRAEAREKMAALTDAFEKKEWQRVGELLEQIPEELEDGPIRTLVLIGL